MVDSWLCLSGEFPHETVFLDLYGVTAEGIQMWEEVPEIMAATGFRASLQSEGWVTPEFQGIFQKLLDLALPYPSASELKESFGTNNNIAHKFQDLQDCYDRIIFSQRQQNNQRYN